MTDYRKLDAALASALTTGAGGADGFAEPGLAVFVRLSNEPAPDRARLAELGLPETAEPGQVCTTALSARQVEELSEQPWVSRLSLSDLLSPLEDC